MYNIFIIEDQEIIRTAYQEIIDREPDLRICGEAETGDEALTLLQKVKADIILLDLSLPDVNSLLLLKILRDRYPVLPILVVSGQDKFAYQGLTLRTGATGYLDKLNVVPDLVETVRQLILSTTYRQKSKAHSDWS